MRRAAMLLVVAPALACGCGSSPSGAEPSPASTALVGSLSRGPAAFEAEPTGVLGVEDCVRLALVRTADLAAFEARVEAARALVVSAETWPNPTLGALVQDIGATDRALAQVSVSHPVLFGWTRGLREQVARAGVEGATLEVEDERRLIAASVGAAFYDALAADELLEAERVAAETAAELRALLTRRAAGGDASLLDEERARAEELEALRQLDLAVERRDQARLLLSVLVGARRPDALRLDGAWPTDLDDALGPAGPAAREAALPALVAAALERRPDARRARSRLEQAGLSGELEERRALPLADVSVTLAGRSGGPGHTGLVGVSAPLPLFDTNQGARRRAAAESLAASAEVDRVRRRVEAEVEGAVIACRRARGRLLDLAAPLLESRERALALARRLFEGGELAPTDVVLIQRDADSARRSLILARRELAGARWRLLVAVGQMGPAGARSPG